MEQASIALHHFPHEVGCRNFGINGWSVEVRPDIRERNQRIAERRILKYNERGGVRVGDYLRFGGVLYRVTYLLDDGAQTVKGDGGSFYLGDGFLSYSGGLLRPVPFDNIRVGNYTLESGRFWFFENDSWRAHGAVEGSAMFRVFEATGEPPT